jgi:hypothetical protein
VTETTWEARGTVLAACNCDYGCPCNFNAPPTQGYCDGGYSWHVEEGSFDGVALDGLNLSIFAKWPGAIHEGGGEVIAFYDERAGDGQRDALLSLLSGEAGGPWGIFAGTYSFVRPPAPARYELELAGERSTLRIGDAVVLEVEPIRNPVTGAEVHPRIQLPEGLVVKELDVFRSRSYSVSDGISYEHPDKYVLLGPFSYTGP